MAAMFHYWNALSSICGLITGWGTDRLAPASTPRSNTMTQTVLLAGATGMFGSHIARCFLDQRDARVRLLIRSSEDAKKKAALSRCSTVVPRSSKATWPTALPSIAPRRASM